MLPGLLVALSNQYYLRWLRLLTKVKVEKSEAILKPVFHVQYTRMCEKLNIPSNQTLCSRKILSIQPMLESANQWG